MASNYLYLLKSILYLVVKTEPEFKLGLVCERDYDYVYATLRSRVLRVILIYLTAICRLELVCS